MKAIRIHGVRDARIEDLPIPGIGPDDVLVRVRAVGVCRSDVEFFDGENYFVRTNQTTLPFTIGHEWSGEVVECGTNATAFKPGDRVTGECSVGCRACDQCRRGFYHQCRDKTETGILKRQGAFAEYISFPRFFLHHLGALAFETGATVEPTGISLYAVKLGRVTPEDDVVVVGPGTIGLLAVAAARAYGARRIILVGRNAGRLELGRRMGANVLVDSRSQDPAAAVREATGGHLASVVIEAVGSASAWPHVASCVAPMGRIVLTGITGGEKYTVDFDPLVINSVTIVGSLGAPNCWPEVIALQQSGRIDTTPMISHRFGLDDFHSAIETARGKDGTAGKVMVLP